MTKFQNLMKMSAAALGLLAAMGSAQAGLLTATDRTFGSFDANAGTRTLTLGSGQISDVNIRITFAKCDDPSIGVNGTNCIGTGFSFDREIVFRLTDPSGNIVNLVNAGTYSGASPGSGRQTVEFDDEAASVVGGPSVVSGSFRPVGNLSGFDGLNALGNWTLFIQDTFGQDRSRARFTGPARSGVDGPGGCTQAQTGLSGFKPTTQPASAGFFTGERSTQLLQAQ